MKITPYTDKHAIKNVLFAFELTNPIPPSILAELRSGEVADGLSAVMPRVQEIPSFVFEIEATNQGKQPTQVQDIGGFQFDSLKPNGEAAWALVVQPNQFFVTCGDYQRWNPTWRNAKNILRIILPWILKHSSIRVIALQYLDEFRIEDNPDQAPLTELYNIDSGLMAKNSLIVPGDFHSHHGFYTDVKIGDADCKCLINVNVNAGRHKTIKHRQISTIQTVHKILLASPLDGSAEALLSDSGSIDTALAMLHTQNKNIVGDLLTDEVKAMINFDSVVKEGA